MRWAVLAALASARLLRGANETVPCELPEDLRNHTANGWSLLAVADTNLVALGMDVDDEEGSTNVLLYDCKQRKRLLFAHIPKNAGSTIENIAFNKGGVSWGYRQPGFHRNKQRMPDGNVCSKWHVPPAYMAAPNPYNNAEVFCVTRHPYDRALSEYRYLLNVKWGYDNPRLRAKPECTPAGLNFFVAETLRLVQAGQTFISDCHFTPQSQFIWGPHKQWCTNILRLDTLPGSFNTLMAKKGYAAVKLGPHKHNSMAHACNGLSTASFWPETKRLLNAVYAQDFAKLGYTPPFVPPALGYTPPATVPRTAPLR